MDACNNNGNCQNKMTIQDVRNVLYSKEFWEAQRSYIGAKRNLDNALREVRYNIDRANTIDCDVKSKYGNEDQKSQSKLRSSIVSENKRYSRIESISSYLKLLIKCFLKSSRILVYLIVIFLKFNIAAFIIEAIRYKEEFLHGISYKEHRLIRYPHDLIAFVDQPYISFPEQIMETYLFQATKLVINMECP